MTKHSIVYNLRSLGIMVHEQNVMLLCIQWRSQRGPRGHGPPLLVNVFSPVNLRRYVLRVCACVRVALLV